MSSRRLSACIGAAAVWSLAAAACAGAVLEDAVWRAFEQRGMAPDTNTVRRLTLDALVKAADAGGRIVSPPEADALLRAPSVAASEAWPEGLCYLRLDGLFENGGTDVVSRVAAWADAGKTGVILDLRGAGGDDVEAAYTIAGALAAAGVTRRGRPARAPSHTVLQSAPGEAVALPVETMFEAGFAAAPAQALPVMLLVDGDTRGASELLAAVMKQQGGVLLIGRPTRGEGVLGEVLPLTSGEGLYLVTRRVEALAPPAAAFTGVDPDIAVAIEPPPAFPAPDAMRPGRTLSEKAVLDRELMERVAGDAALMRATDILLGLKALALYGSTTNSTDSAGPGE